MHPLNMLLHIPSLIKALPTIIDWTNKWILLTVNAHVSVEFANTAKDFIAGVVLVLEEVLRYILKLAGFEEVLDSMILISNLLLNCLKWLHVLLNCFLNLMFALV